MPLVIIRLKGLKFEKNIYFENKKNKGVITRSYLEVRSSDTNALDLLIKINTYN